MAFSSFLCSPGCSTRSGSAMQETLGTKVLVNIRPVDPVPRSGNAPVRALLRRRVQQTWVPGQGNRYGSSVKKINTNSVVSDAYVSDALTCFRFQSSHSTPPIIFFGALGAGSILQIEPKD